jgi:hypothetical protein
MLYGILASRTLHVLRPVWIRGELAALAVLGLNFIPNFPPKCFATGTAGWQRNMRSSVEKL